MEVRPFEMARDYPTISEWWSQHKDWVAVPPQFLPETGMIVDGYCAAFLYRTDSSFAWLEWVVSNPKSDKENRSQALDMLIHELIRAASQMGYGAIFSAVKHPGLQKRYEKFGFKTTDSGMTHGIWSL